MGHGLRVGAAEVDITPPVGLWMMGSLTPRPSQGVADPLTIKAVVLESRGVRLAYALIDTAIMGRDLGDRAVTLASQRTGIPEDHIFWAANHTHSGPVMDECLYGPLPQAHRAYLDHLPDSLAQAVEQADRARQPASMSRSRGYCIHAASNRRYKFKDGREINRWLFNAGEEEVQCLGSAAPTDPEIGILCFDDAAGRPLAVLWQYTAHSNAYFGPLYSADFPGVVAVRLREHCGPQVISLFMPGAFGDINPDMSYRAIGDLLADEIILRLRKRQPRQGEPELAGSRREMVVPCRDFDQDQEPRLLSSQWSEECREFFRTQVKMLRERGVREERTWIGAWRIAEMGFAHLPGELFVDWGLQIKARSPFPWTYPVHLSGDYQGYLVTAQAWKAGGYEPLCFWGGRVSVEGVNMMVEGTLEMLEDLWAAGGGKPIAS